MILHRGGRSVCANAGESLSHPTTISLTSQISGDYVHLCVLLTFNNYTSERYIIIYVPKYNIYLLYMYLTLYRV